MSDREAEAVALLPCPFCGAIPDFIPDDSYGQCWINCECKVGPFHAGPKESPNATIAEWNRRTLPAEPARVSGGIEELKAKWQGGTLYDVGTIRSAIDQAAAIVASERDGVAAIAREIVEQIESDYLHDKGPRRLVELKNLMRQALAASRPPETARAEG